jgi:hypothetical protein
MYKGKPRFPSGSFNTNDQMPQIDFNREEDKDSKANPRSDDHYLGEHNVLTPHEVVFAAKEGGRWVIEIQRDVRENHPCDERQLCVKGQFYVQGIAIHEMGESICQHVWKANHEAEHDDNGETKSSISQITTVVPVRFP